jgi:NADH-quinone oxidoreductase subunit L
MHDLLWLIPALPLAGFGVLLVAGRRLGDPAAGWLATLVVAASFGVTVAVLTDLLSRPAEERVLTQTLFTWVPAGALRVGAGLLADPLSVAMALFVTGVGSLIHLYAIGYMRGDPGFSRFFTYLNLFVFSMLTLVLADNFLLMFLGWEGVGVCSYFLISFWFERPAAATAGKKAFVTNRVGDWGFMLAIFLVFSSLGTVQYAGVFAGAETLTKTTATAIALLFFVGAVGKSAQLPLYLWLPDAMEGPTPVSALIHAATMVTAGVYLMVRISPILELAPAALTVVATVGVITAFFAAAAACAQDDIKRVLAYSTISQLGFMFLAVGSKAYVAAVFHMVTHAFFKALLFLGAGSVIHGLHEEQDMKRMGGLRRFMPLTAATFIAGWLAIAGIPPFAGFWSKDEIIATAFHTHHYPIYAVALLTAFVTALYMTRAVVLTFFGSYRGSAHPHESPLVMTVPMVVLAALSAGAGFLNAPFSHLFRNWLGPPFGPAGHEPYSFALAGISVLTALAGVALGWRLYGRQPERDPLLRLGPAYTLLVRKYFLDDLYLRGIVRPIQYGLSAVADWTNQRVLDGAVNAAAWLARKISVGVDEVDRRAVDGAVNGVAFSTSRTGGLLRYIQSGNVQRYAVFLFVGVAVLAIAITRL